METCCDLMIGDWVECNGKFIQVENVHKDMINYTPDIPYVQEEYFIDGKDITPIPLTAEILEKNGFEYYNYGHNDYGWKLGEDETFVLHKRYNSDEYEIGSVVEDRESYYLEKYMSIHYVHELQHALRLCGIKDKEIEL